MANCRATGAGLPDAGVPPVPGDGVAVGPELAVVPSELPPPPPPQAVSTAAAPSDKVNSRRFIHDLHNVVPAQYGVNSCVDRDEPQALTLKLACVLHSTIANVTVSHSGVAFPSNSPRTPAARACESPSEQAQAALRKRVQQVRADRCARMRCNQLWFAAKRALAISTATDVLQVLQLRENGEWHRLLPCTAARRLGHASRSRLPRGRAAKNPLRVPPETVGDDPRRM